MEEKRSKDVNAMWPPIRWATCSPSKYTPPISPIPAKDGKSVIEVVNKSDSIETFCGD